MVKYFVSHSEKDKEYSEAFVDLLRLGFDIQRDDIFCSSYSGCNITKGKDFVDYIDKKLKNTDIVFALFSHNYIKSSFCVAELGASWNSGKTVFPILLNDNIKYSQLTALFEHISATKITDKIGLSNIADVIQKECNNISIENFNNQFEKFIERIVPIKDSSEPSDIDYLEYKKKEQENNKLNEIIKSLKNIIQEKDKEIEQIKSLKDREEIKEYEAEKNKDSILEFRQKSNMFANSLAKYSKFVQYMFYKYACNESISYREVHDKALDNDVNDALEKKLIEDIDNGYIINQNSIKTKKIIEELENFKKYISNLPDEVINYVNEDLGLEIDITDIDFWKECFSRYFL